MRGKHVSTKADTQEIDKIREERPVASFTYEDEETVKKMPKTLPKWVYRSVLILAAAAVILAIGLNAGNLTPNKIVNWLKVQIMGVSASDGFPVSITGSNVMKENFTQQAGVAAVLSDTSLSFINTAGEEVSSIHHSFSDPALASAEGMYMLYNVGSTGYILESGGETLLNGTAPNDLLAAAVAQNGRYLLGMQGSDGASYFNVYFKDGTLQYNYIFAKDYITAVTLNYDGSYGAVATVRSEKGELISKITVFDFQSAEPVTSYEMHGTLLLGLYWSDNGQLYGVGDTAAVSADTATFTFREYYFESRQLTAFHFDENKAYVSVSSYEHTGPSTILVIDGSQEYKKIETGSRVEDISVSGSVVGTLEETSVNFYDAGNGNLIGSASAGTDAKSIALINNRSAFVLGVNEIRATEMK